MSPETKAKIVEATRGSQVGAIIACALGVVEPAPCFTSKAIVTSDGFLQANFVDRDGIARHSAFVGSYDDLKSNMRSVQEYLRHSMLKQVSEDALHELWNAVVYDWIATDYRN